MTPAPSSFPSGQYVSLRFASQILAVKRVTRRSVVFSKIFRFLPRAMSTSCATRFRERVFVRLSHGLFLIARNKNNDVLQRSVTIPKKRIVHRRRRTSRKESISVFFFFFNHNNCMIYIFNCLSVYRRRVLTVKRSPGALLEFSSRFNSNWF